MADNYNETKYLKAVDDAQNFLNKNQSQPPGTQNNDGFTVPPTYSADGNGLPYNNVPSQKRGQLKRNIITWFVPQFGIVRMYINPQSISFKNTKVIDHQRTKGGYTVQYWGEDLTQIAINGNTGSAGIEGINVLYQLYRAEQYAFDSVGLTLAANNVNNDLSHNLVNGVASMFGGSATTQAGVSGLLGGVLGIDSPNNTLSAKNIPSLAQLAATVEMYYNGQVYRGYFKDMAVNEHANNFLIDYTINFVATQVRGYRTNYFPWTRSAKDGPSRYDTDTSFNVNKSNG
jgi:hypothetical protein